MLLLIKHLANDMSSPKVRQSVIKGMTQLVKTCPRSHVYLKQILPKLKDVLFDSNEGVRSSMIELLTAVKGIKTVHFWSICPLEDILDRLARDKKPIANKIVNLLFNSFFPLDQSEDAKLERCVYLIKNEPEASRRFYLYLDKMVSLHDTVKFMMAILVSLKRQAQHQLQTMNLTEDDPDKENQHANHTSINQNDSTVLKDGSIRLANDTLQVCVNPVRRKLQYGILLAKS